MATNTFAIYGLARFRGADDDGRVGLGSGRVEYGNHGVGKFARAAAKVDLALEFTTPNDRLDSE